MRQPSGCLGLLLKLVGVAPKGAGAQAYPFGVRDDFLSPAELSFYHVLRSALPPDAAVAMKVRLGDILFVRQPHQNQAARNRINQKHVDFLLCDAATMKPRLVIELDDSSHQRVSRQERDAFVDEALAAAGLPILHITAARSYVPQEVWSKICEKLSVRSPPIPKP